MKGSAEIFLTKMEGLFGPEPEFYRGMETADDIIPPAVLVFKHTPQRGYMTCVTYGLSFADHSSWKMNRKPELIMTINSTDVAWAITLADIVSEMRAEFAFSYGQSLSYPQKITETSKMDSFLIFAPAILKPEQYLDIDIGQPYKICLTGIYPVTKKELSSIKEYGLEKFWKSDDFDYLNIYR